MGQMSGGKGAPSAPDFTAVANQQTQANRPNQTTPWATSSWTQAPGQQTGPSDADLEAQFDRQGVPESMRADLRAQMLPQLHAQQPQGKWSQQVGLAPGLDQANQSLMGQFASANANPLDNGAQARQHAEDAIYGRETSRLDPQWQQRQHDFQTQLANQGIDPSSQAYATAQGNFDRGRNDAYQQANYGAITGGGQEAERQQGMDLRSRAAPLVGMQGLQGLTGMPGFAQSQLLPAAMAQYQAALQQYGISQQGKNSSLGGLMNLGGTLGGAALLGPAAPLAKAGAGGNSPDPMSPWS